MVPREGGKATALLGSEASDVVWPAKGNRLFSMPSNVNTAPMVEINLDLEIPKRNRWIFDWKGDYKGIVKSKIQSYAQEVSARQLYKAVHGMIDESRDISVNEMLNSCGAYIHKHYDGDPALNLGSSHYQMRNYAEADRAYSRAALALRLGLLGF